jgi:hypothetical protein
MIRLKSLLFEQTGVPGAIYNTPGPETNMAGLAAVARNYNPPSVGGYIRITDGNQWLATQRANNLRRLIQSNLFPRFTEPFPESNITFNIPQVQVLGPGAQNQYIQGSINIVMKYEPVPIAANYDLIYRFYELNGVPHIVVSKRGQGSPTIGGGTEQSDASKIKLFQNFAAMQEPGAKLIKTLSKTSPTEYSIIIPIDRFIEPPSEEFNNKSMRQGSRLYFSAEENLNALRSFIQTYTDGQDDYTTKPDPKSEGQYISSNWSKTFGGAGNLIGKGKTSTVKILSGDGEGTETTLTRTYQDPSGKGGKITPDNENSDTRPLPYDLPQPRFPANMIRPNPADFNQIFTQIANDVNNSIIEGYKPISLGCTIAGFASSANATNKAARGVTPDHTYGGAIQLNQWINNNGQ